MEKIVKPTIGRRLLNNFSRLLQHTIWVSFLYSMIVHIVNEYYLILSGAAKGMTPAAALEAHPVLHPIVQVSIPCEALPPPFNYVCTVLVICIVLGYFTFYILKWVCQWLPVQEPMSFEKCWDCDCGWDFLCWLACPVSGLFCTAITILEWVLKWLCAWTWYIVTAAIVICVLGGLIIAAG